MQVYIGQEVEVSLMVLDEQKRTFTASMNNAVSDRALRQLRIGALVWGTARRLTNYGVFLSLDDTFESALLHITNVSWNRVPTIESVCLSSLGLLTNNCHLLVFVEFTLSNSCFR
jgi:ribosomal protein S1